jgi:FtsP/CotA-like multicopper oxidase with cupredoxin domain
MDRLRARLLIGLVVAVALAWGATLDLTAAKAAVKATATVTADAVAPAKAPAKTTARTARRATATVASVLPSEPFPGTLAAAVAGATPQGKAKGKVTRDQAYVEKFKRIAPSQQKAAAKAARLKGLKPGIAGVTAMDVGISPGGVLAPSPGGVPHYFGPYGNWAFSPLPTGPIATVSVVAGGTGYHNPVVTVDDAYVPTGSFTLATVTATADPLTGAITGLTLGGGGSGYMAPVVTITDDPTKCGVAPQPACGTGALGDAFIGGTVTGGMLKFVDLLPGIPGVTSHNTVANGYNADGSNNLGQYLSLATPQGWPIGCVGAACTADYYEIALVEYAEQMHSSLPVTKLRGYVQLSTPGALGAQVPLVNPDGTPVLMPDGLTQAKGVDKPRYLGPSILATGKVAGLGPAGAPRPVRIKFYNLLPNSASGGNLLLPVDETVSGSGIGPALPGAAGDKFTQNRATIHLHGNNTVWISDGNTHQWISPASETTPYPAGVSARNVPDMGTACDAVAGTGLPGDAASKKSSGCMTFYYTNAQSARLQFYHDHAHGITRLNVYAGEAAGYVVTDVVEQDMINGTNNSGVNPGSLKVLPDIGIPLVIQDKTWVDPAAIYAQDPTWAWGSGAPGTAVAGDFWYPHVYMTVTNPADPTGTNPYGRWFYGPWFINSTPVCVNGGPVGCIEVGPVPNPYHQPDCDLFPPGPGCTAPWEPPLNPGTPNPSIPGESFLDTPIVNGTAYPVLKVDAKPYRFRILNASNDRAQNLQLYVAADKTGPTTANTNYALTPALICDPAVLPAVGLPSPGPAANCTEVKMVPVGVAPANQYGDTPSGIPDPATAGPSWIQIGTEGGFTPAPVVIPPQPIGYNLDPAYFNFGIVNQHSLFLMAAERADVIVDFTAYAGKTLILYNDSPAPVPAGAAPYDFFTGDGNSMGIGGAPNTLPGYGPNIRTIMQIQVSATTDPLTQVTLPNLQAVFAKAAGKRGVFEVSQDPIIIPQAAYNSAYNQSFPTAASTQFILNMSDTQKTFQPLGYTPATLTTPDAWTLQPAVTIPFEMKAMHDEMGGVYDTGFGRMSGMLGLSNPTSTLGFILPFPFSSPPTDVVKGSLESTKIGDLADGTQIWRIFHNGVDTHPIHTHLFTAQVISRVGQDGQVVPGPFPGGQAVDAQDLGWKDTFKVNPLEVTFLALRPTVPTPSEIPFELPNSVRLIDPTLPEGATLPPPGPAGWFDPSGNPIAEILNHTVNFGWEYVWHCHILSHEEMDFMHSLVFAVPPKAPTLTSALLSGNGNNRRVDLVWTDNSIAETSFTVERASDANFVTGLVTLTTTLPANTTTYRDVIGNVSNVRYWYRVRAVTTVGDSVTAGFPTMSADAVSTNSLSVTVGTPTTAVPANPTLLSATVQAGPQVTLTWRDNATTETGFSVQRCTGSGCTNFVEIALAPARSATGNTTYVDTTVAAGNTYTYQVYAVNANGQSLLAAGPAVAVVLALPAAPTNFTVAVVRAGGPNDTATLTWAAAVNPTNFTIQRANNLAFTTGLTSFTAGGTARSLTQTVNRNTVYYYRIQANNSSGSSAWTNAQPFPIRTP